MDKHSIDNYNKIKALFLEKDCILITTYEAFFNTEKINCKSKYKIISKCGHETNVMMAGFKQHGTGIICSNCLKKNKKSKEDSDFHFNETFGINILKKYINDNLLEIIILNEGTNADIVIKPKNIKEDLYLPIQIKTTEKIYHNNQYRFTLNKKDYNNMLVILICIQEEKIWIIDDYSNLKKNNHINISKNSKYNRYYIEENNDLANILLNYYNTKNYNLSLNKINTPIQPSKQKEMYYKKLREDNLSFVNFTYDDVQQQSYDFKINNKYKVQEKIAIINNDIAKNGMRVNLQKGIGGRKQGPYAFGDNDYYVFHIQDNRHFYWIPEKVLYEQKYLTDEKNNIKGKICILLYPYGLKRKIKSNWTKEYLFNYNNLDLFKEKFPELLIKENCDNIIHENFKRLEDLQNEYKKNNCELKNTYKILPTKEELIDYINIKHMSQQKIADKYTISRSVIRRLVKKYLIKRVNLL